MGNEKEKKKKKIGYRLKPRESYNQDNIDVAIEEHKT